MLTKNDENKWAKLDHETLYIREVDIEADEVVAETPSGAPLVRILSSIESVSIF